MHHHPKLTTGVAVTTGVVAVLGIIRWFRSEPSQSSTGRRSGAVGKLATLAKSLGFMAVRNALVSSVATDVAQDTVAQTEAIVPE